MGNSHQRRREHRGMAHTSKNALTATSHTTAPSPNQAGKTAKPTGFNSRGTVENRKRNWRQIFGIIAGSAATVLGIVTGFLTLFPRLTVSDPIQMDATDLFSYQITIANDGLLPVRGVRWAMAPRIIKVGGNISQKPMILLAPHYADWVFPNSVTKPDTSGIQRHADLMFFPGSQLAVVGPADYEFHIRPTDTYIGWLSPGDRSTFTTEGIISAPPEATYDTVDFAIAITYLPIWPMPPIPMQTCPHFRIYKDRQGTPHWFRDTDQCAKFPWWHLFHQNRKWDEAAPQG
jgi:hypothetical protein